MQTKNQQQLLIFCSIARLVNWHFDLIILRLVDYPTKYRLIILTFKNQPLMYSNTNSNTLRSKQVEEIIIS